MPKSKLEKQNEAASRAEERSKRGDKGQLARLDSLFGKGIAAAKERARISARPSAQKEEEPKKAKRAKAVKE